MEAVWQFLEFVFNTPDEFINNSKNKSLFFWYPIFLLIMIKNLLLDILENFWQEQSTVAMQGSYNWKFLELNVKKGYHKTQWKQDICFIDQMMYSFDCSKFAGSFIVARHDTSLLCRQKLTFSI